MLRSLLCIILLLSLSSSSSSSLLSFDLMTQLNAPTRYPISSNRIMCHNVTDISPSVLLYTADDFLIGNLPETVERKRYESLIFNLNTVRTFQDKNPDSITIELMYHDSVYNRPGTIFFKRTMLSPDGTGTWDSITNIPIITTIVVKQGDMDDDGITSFDFTNETFLPFNTTLWFAFYITGRKNFSYSTFKENNMFWVSLDSRVGSSQVVNPFLSQPNVIPNYDYHYKDVSNYFKLNATNWTDAKLIQGAIGISTITYNMAWNVKIVYSLISQSPSLQPDSSIITQSPSSSSSSNDTVIPSPYTNKSSISPSIKPTNTSISDSLEPSPPATMKTTNIVLPLFGVLALLIVMLCVFFFLYKTRERSKGKIINSQSFYDNMQDNENRLVNLINNAKTSGDDHVGEWTSDNMMTEVDLSTNGDIGIGGGTGMINRGKKQQSMDNISQWVDKNITPQTVNNSYNVNDDNT